jgi:NADH dehydrogenase
MPLAFAQAEREIDAAWHTFVVFGAGAIAHIARHTLPGEFRRVDPRNARGVRWRAWSASCQASRPRRRRRRACN